MPLTDEERKQLESLIKKDKEPDKSSGGNGRNEQVQIIIDLSDKQATDRAIAFGILKQSDLIEGADEDLEVIDDDDDDDDDDVETTGKKAKESPAKPAARRRSYFKDDAA